MPIQSPVYLLYQGLRSDTKALSYLKEEFAVHPGHGEDEGIDAPSKPQAVEERLRKLFYVQSLSLKTLYTSSKFALSSAS